MAMTTTYLTVNGKIRSEQRAGEAHSRDYVLDRLGSVIQIYQNGWPIADACYEPYGGIYTQWNMTGKTFTWLGGWGYRQTGVEWSSVYVRARHYSRGLSNWTSIDPLWPSEMAYGYVGGGVMTGVDPSGFSKQLHLELKGPCKRYRVYECGTGDDDNGRPLQHFPPNPIKVGGWMPMASFGSAFSKLQSECGVSAEAITKMLCEENCCDVAKSVGADPLSVCTLALTERTTRSIKDGPQDLSASLGAPQGQSFGCLQIQVKRAKYILLMAQACNVNLYVSLAPLHVASSKSAIAKQLLNCNYSLRLASIEQLLRKTCPGFLTPDMEDPVRMRDPWKIGTPKGFAISWNANSALHRGRTECVYSILKEAGVCG